jgi:hypothetical protein
VEAVEEMGQHRNLERNRRKKTSLSGREITEEAY